MIIQSEQVPLMTCGAPYHPWWHLSVGICVGVAGCLVAILPFFREPQRIGKMEKLIWTLLVVGLTVLELRMIKWSDSDAGNDRAYAECLQFQQFHTILKDNQVKFENTLANVKEVYDKTKLAADTAKDAANKITGGDGFTYLAFYGNPGTFASIVKVGNAPLYDVTVGMTYCLGAYAKLPEISVSALPKRATPVCLGMESLGGKVLGDYPVGNSPLSGFWSMRTDELSELQPKGRKFTPVPGPVLLNASFASRNGRWEEYIWIRPVKPTTRSGDEWEEAIRVYKVKFDSAGIPYHTELLFQRVPKDFPREMISNNTRQPWK